MPYICAKCRTVFEEQSVRGRVEKLRCPKCGSDHIISPSRKSLDAIDRSLMPIDFHQNPIDPRTVDFYKLSTFTDEKRNTDFIVLHCKNDRGEGNILKISPPLIRPYFWINVDDYKQHTNQVDYILNKVGATVKDEYAIGSDRQRAMKVEFRTDLDRKRTAITLEGLVREYESNRPLTNRISPDLGLKVKSLPTRLYFDIEVDPEVRSY
jgi:DNA-directed RNA polymerase subunit RPC12/RpoP